MNKMMKKMVRQEIRRTLKPTGLLGKRGPAKNIPIMVRRQLESNSHCPHCPAQSVGGSQ